MAKGVYIGVNNSAKKVKQIYIGVNGQAKKVKKGYIGVNGQAKLFFSSENFTYDGVGNSSQALTTGRYSMMCSNWYMNDYSPNYVYFAGGKTNSSSYSNVVNAYNSNLTRSTPSALTVSRSQGIGANNSVYTFIVGGTNGSAQSTIDVYSESTGTKSNYFTGYIAVYDLAGGNAFGDVAMWGGGSTAVGSSNISSRVYYASSSSSTTAGTDLPVAVFQPSFAACSNRAFFAGGRNSSSTDLNTVSIYNSAITRTGNATGLSVATFNVIGVSTPKYAYFISGNTTSAAQRYDSNGTKTSLSNANGNTSYFYGSGTGNGKWAMVCGGENYSDNAHSYISVYHEDGTTLNFTGNLSQSKEQLSACAIGNRIIVAGGTTSYNGSGLTTVELFTAES